MGVDGWAGLHRASATNIATTAANRDGSPCRTRLRMRDVSTSVTVDHTYTRPAVSDVMILVSAGLFANAQDLMGSPCSRRGSRPGLRTMCHWDTSRRGGARGSTARRSKQKQPQPPLRWTR